MQYTLHTERLALTALDIAHLEKKLAHLEKRLSPPYITHVTITHDGHHRKGTVINCIIHITQGKAAFHGARTAETVASSIDEVTDALEKELSKAKEKAQRQARKKTRQGGPEL